jgi:hypothetical protein
VSLLHSGDQDYNVFQRLVDATLGQVSATPETSTSAENEIWSSVDAALDSTPPIASPSLSQCFQGILQSSPFFRSPRMYICLCARVFEYWLAVQPSLPQPSQSTQRLVKSVSFTSSVSCEAKGGLNDSTDSNIDDVASSLPQQETVPATPTAFTPQTSPRQNTPQTAQKMSQGTSPTTLFTPVRPTTPVSPAAAPRRNRVPSFLHVDTDVPRHSPSYNGDDGVCHTFRGFDPTGDALTQLIDAICNDESAEQLQELLKHEEIMAVLNDRDSYVRTEFTNSSKLWLVILVGFAQDNYSPLVWAAKLNQCKAVEILCGIPIVLINAEAGWVP